ncbi:NAD(P)-dependent methylenetetrahydromethanopterin dehydrogenase [Marinimicrococcus flavescens]|uniref:Methylenetetrahydromethanopterin dehydrogenase n=1 Tax=Marinimicrococcus flavescens TaxID=3031815 RepID=A0AAP3XPN9_9PROT|nr:methylenetetrahydromethanopterin dehydrogenase [Marinimicrococcus flavescens]
MPDKRSILHFVTPLKNVSPFDVNMAVDAGFDMVVPYAHVEVKELTGLVQDAIFSRAPEDGRHTAILIGGRDPLVALDMLEAAGKAMMPPHFEISVMADPSGAFTTAAGMIAVTEKHLRRLGKELAGTKVAVFGATGPVGGAAGLIAARAGAQVVLVGHDGLERVADRCTTFENRFGVAMRPADGSDEPKKEQVLDQVEVVLAAGRAGLQILSREQLTRAGGLLVALDVNAVPPAGLEGVDAFDDGKPVEGGKVLGVGALAVGNVKFKTEHELLAGMTDASPRRHVGLEEAFEAARRHAAG